MKDSAQSMHSARSSDKSNRLRESDNSTSIRTVLETLSSSQKLTGSVRVLRLRARICGYMSMHVFVSACACVHMRLYGCSCLLCARVLAPAGRLHWPVFAGKKLACPSRLKGFPCLT